MFKRELKFNLKAFIIWTAILIGMFVVVFLIYPSIVNSENIQLMDEMMAMYPEEVLKAFNMDIASMDSTFGWLKTEGFVFALLIIGCYAGILGSNIVLKEESDKTIEYLNSLPVKRSKILINKFLVGIFYIVVMVVLLGICNFIGLKLSEEFDEKQFILLSITPLFSSLAIYSVCMFISTFAHKTKKMLGISLGLVFISYILQTLSELSEEVEFLKYFSFFTLADVRNVIMDVRINPCMIFISLGIIVVFLILSLIRFEKKDLI